MEDKRIWAMVGAVYVILATLLTTYWIATTSLLTGITGLMLVPLCGGMCAQCLNWRWKAARGLRKGNPLVFLLLAIACGAGTLLTLVIGTVQLIGQF